MRLGVEADPVEQHRLADAPQSVEDDASGRAPGSDTIERDGGTLEDGVPPRQFGRRRAGARCVRVEPGLIDPAGVFPADIEPSESRQ